MLNATYDYFIILLLINLINNWYFSKLIINKLIPFQVHAYKPDDEDKSRPSYSHSWDKMPTNLEFSCNQTYCKDTTIIEESQTIYCFCAVLFACIHK